MHTHKRAAACLASGFFKILMISLVVEALHQSSGVLADVLPDASSGLPTTVLNATDLDAAVRSYLTDVKAVDTALPNNDSLQSRIERIRETSAHLGEQDKFDLATKLLSALVKSGYAKPWTYEALVVAMQCSSQPPQEIERAILSAADYTSDPLELVGIAAQLSKQGFPPSALKLCKRAGLLDDACREAFALGITLLDVDAPQQDIEFFTTGTLRQDWLVKERDFPRKAHHLASALVSRLEKEGLDQETEAFKKTIQDATCRDLEIEVTWNGDADVDLVVMEPPGTTCTMNTPRTSSGGTLLGDDKASQKSASKHERYTAALAFPGTYKVLATRSLGTVTAGYLTADVVFFKGTDREFRQRRTLPLEGDTLLFSVELPNGRRTTPVPEAQLAIDLSSQREVGRAVLAQQLATMDDPSLVDTLTSSRPPSSAGGRVPNRYTTSGPVGYQPQISTLTDGAELSVLAVVSGDRRYVRITAEPSFTFTDGGGGGGNQGGNQGGNRNGNQGGNFGGNQGGNQGGNRNGNQGGNFGGNQGGNFGGNQGGQGGIGGGLF